MASNRLGALLLAATTLGGATAVEAAETASLRVLRLTAKLQGTNAGSAVLKARWRPGLGGVDPTIAGVTVTVGSFSQTIPGSAMRGTQGIARGVWRFRGSGSGITGATLIRSRSRSARDSWKLVAKVRDADLGLLATPIEVDVAIGGEEGGDRLCRCRVRNGSVMYNAQPGTFPLPETAVDGNKGGDGAVADLNGDGISDYAMVRRFSDELVITLGATCATQFSTPEQDTVGAPRYIGIGEFTGDGVADIVVGGIGAAQGQPLPNGGIHSSVVVHAGNGDGTFAAAQLVIDRDDQLWGLEVADLNGDGADDLLLPGSTGLGGGVRVYLGQGDGTFVAAGVFTAGDAPRALAVGDVNADGHLDVAAVARSNDLTVLLGDGAGSFTALPPVAVGQFPVSVALGDVDGDGILDAISSHYESDFVSLRLGAGDGTFPTHTAIDVGLEGLMEAQLADIDEDGHLDIALIDPQADRIGIAYGEGAGAFALPEFFSTIPADPGPALFARGQFPIGMRVVDLNGDGRLDLVSAAAFLPQK